MFRQIIGKECKTPGCDQEGLLVASGEICEKCALPLKPIKKWNRGMIAAAGFLVLVAGSAAQYFSRSQPRVIPPLPSPPPDLHEITLAFTLEMLGEHDSVSLVAPDRVFRSGERFRVVLKPDFNAYVYLFNQNPEDARVQILYPVAPKTAVVQPGSETRAPGDEGWFRMDRKSGSEVLILVASPNPLPELKPVNGTLDRRVFESWLAKTEEEAKPKSQRIYQTATWSNLMADASQTPLVFVHRIPLKHE